MANPAYVLVIPTDQDGFDQANTLAVGSNLQLTSTGADGTLTINPIGNLGAIANIDSGGYLAYTGGSPSIQSRSITGDGTISVTNGNGVSGNTILSVAANQTIQKVQVTNNESDFYTGSILNFVGGEGSTINVSNGTANTVDITISAAGGGGSGTISEITSESDHPWNLVLNVDNPTGPTVTLNAILPGTDAGFAARNVLAVTEDETGLEWVTPNDGTISAITGITANPWDLSMNIDLPSGPTTNIVAQLPSDNFNANYVLSIDDTGENVIWAEGGGGGGGAPTDAYYILQQTNGSLPNGVTLNDLSSDHGNIIIGGNGTVQDTGGNNAVIGFGSFTANTTGGDNAGLGAQVFYQNNTGGGNTAFGSQSMYTNEEGSNNVALGYNALFNYHGTASSWENNTAVGWQAGSQRTRYNNCTFLGYNADAADETFQNAMALGANTTVGSSNSCVIGNDVNIGIGTNNPTYGIHLGGAGSNFTPTIFISNSSGLPTTPDDSGVLFSVNDQICIESSDPKFTGGIVVARSSGSAPLSGSIQITSNSVDIATDAYISGTSIVMWGLFWDGGGTPPAGCTPSYYKDTSESVDGSFTVYVEGTVPTDNNTHVHWQIFQPV